MLFLIETDTTQRISALENLNKKQNKQQLEQQCEYFYVIKNKYETSVAFNEDTYNFIFSLPRIP